MNNEQSGKKLLENLIRAMVQEELIFEQLDYKSNVVYKAFLEPFSDVLQTAAHGVETVSARILGETKLLAKQLAFLFLPFLNPDAGSISNMTAQERQKIASKLSSIDGKFKDVLDRNWQAFNNPDVWGTFFLLYPQAAITQKLLSKAPEAALELLEVLTGGSETVSRLLQGYRNLRTGGPGRGSHQSGGGYENGGGGYADDYSLGDYGDYAGLFEQNPPAQVQRTAPQQSQQVPQPITQNVPRPQAQNAQRPNPETWLKTQLNGLLRQPEIARQINASPITKAMQAEAVSYIVRAAQKDLSFSFADLKQKLGSNYEKAISKMAGAPIEEIKKELESNQDLQKKVVADIKALLKPAYIRQLQSLLKVNPQAKQAVAQAVQKVNSL